MRMSKMGRGGPLGRFAGWTLTVLAMLGATTNSFASSAEAALFEGFWKVEADPDVTAERGGRLEFEEYFMIESGVVTAQELSKLGFDPTAATFSTDATGKTTWTVTMESRTQGLLTITGSRDAGHMMLGTIVWERDGQVYRYAYSGSPFTPGSE
jgi:hypothetical protein